VCEISQESILWYCLDTHETQISPNFEKILGGRVIHISPGEIIFSKFRKYKMFYI